MFVEYFEYFHNWLLTYKRSCKIWAQNDTPHFLKFDNLLERKILLQMLSKLILFYHCDKYYYPLHIQIQAKLRHPIWKLSRLITLNIFYTPYSNLNQKKHLRQYLIFVKDHIVEMYCSLEHG